MSIQVICPNGHPLTVNDSSAGRMGLCPVCKAPVKVPQPDSRQVTEDAVLDFIGPAKPEAAAGKSSSGVDPSADQPETPKNPKKRCSRCNREILASLPACPYCHCYLGGE